MKSDHPTVTWDHVVFSLQPQGGISNWWMNHCNIMRDKIACDIQDMGPYQNQNAMCNSLRIGPGQTLTGAPGKLWFLRRARVPERTSFFHGSYFRVPGPGPKVLVSYFDASMPRTASLRGFMHRRMQARCLRRADLIHCISEHTAREMRDVFPWIPREKVRAIPLGIALRDDDIVVPAVDEGQPFVLFVGRRGGYKNGAVAFEAIARMKGTTLFCIGGGFFSPAEQAELARLGLASRVRHLADVSDAGLRWLYRRAMALWYPSSNEGFGFPAIEAAAMGCPVIAASGHAVEEVVKDYAVFSPSPTGEWIADATHRLKPADRQALRAKGAVVAARYSWERYALAMAGVYAELGVPMRSNLPDRSLNHQVVRDHG